MSALTLKTATQLASQALTAGRMIGAAPLTIAVLDNGGHLITLHNAKTAPACCARRSPSARLGARLRWARVRACWRWTRNNVRRLSLR